MESKLSYEFSAKIWRYSGTNGWYFVSLPTALSLEIRKNLQWQEEGWGRMKAVANVGQSQWETAIWFDKKKNTYLLPLKAAIRSSEKLEIGDEIIVKIGI